jgi:hypothetical protein
MELTPKQATKVNQFVRIAPEKESALLHK